MKMQSSFFLQSKRFWGMFVTLVAGVMPAMAQFMGWNFSVSEWMGFGEAVSNAIDSVMAAFGLGLTWYGSLKAKGPMVVTAE